MAESPYPSSEKIETELILVPRPQVFSLNLHCLDILLLHAPPAPTQLHRYHLQICVKLRLSAYSALEQDRPHIHCYGR